jgi:hypothetical protein
MILPPCGQTYIVVVVISRLKSLQVIILGIVNTKSVSQVKEGLARTVISIFTALVNMRMGVAVQDGHSHVVDESVSRATAGVGQKAVEAKPAGWLKQAVLARGGIGLERAEVGSLN